MSGERVSVHELIGDLSGESRRESPGLIDPDQLGLLCLWGSCELMALPRQIGRLGVCLGADGDVLASGHRHGSRNEASDARDEDGGPPGACGGDTDDQARRRDESIVGSENRGAEPPNMRSAMAFVMAHRASVMSVDLR